VLQLKGLLEEEEKYELPPDFLMEVLEINEELMDKSGPGGAELEYRIAELQSAIYEPVKSIIENYKDGLTAQEELLQVKEYYYKKKYLQRISDQLQPKL
jgi:molecular chaperone HscB